MSKGHVTTSVLVGSIVLTTIFIVGSFVDYVPWISSRDMQNIYLGRILRYGIPIVLLQVIALLFVFSDRKEKTTPNKSPEQKAK